MKKTLQQLAQEQKKQHFELMLLQQLRVYRFPVPDRNYQFHPDRGWAFDFAWPGMKRAVEVEGGIWRRGGGAHSRPQNILRDIEKYNAATLLRWEVYRFSTGMVEDGRAITFLKQLFHIQER